jgi:hypothetical protein
VTDEAAFSGRQSLKVQDAEGLTHAYNPHFTFGWRFSNTVVENRFAVGWGPGRVLHRVARLSAGGANAYRTGPCLIFRSGTITARTRVKAVDGAPSAGARSGSLNCGRHLGKGHGDGHAGRR